MAKKLTTASKVAGGKERSVMSPDMKVAPGHRVFASEIWRVEMSLEVTFAPCSRSRRVMGSPAPQPSSRT